MRTWFITLIALLIAAAAMARGDVAFRIVALPRPNSGTFSFEQAEARKSEILSNTPSPKLERTDVGCCLHIEKDDTVTVYNHFLKNLPEYSQARTNRSVAEIVKMVAAIPRDNEPVRILITSDVQLQKSRTIHDVLKVLFIPSIQLLYVDGREPGGAANGSQPIRSANRTASAAGFRR